MPPPFQLYLRTLRGCQDPSSLTMYVIPMLTSRNTKKANSSHGEALGHIHIDHRIKMGRRMCSLSDNSPMQMSCQVNCDRTVEAPTYWRFGMGQPTRDSPSALTAPTSQLVGPWTNHSCKRPGKTSGEPVTGKVADRRGNLRRENEPARFDTSTNNLLVNS
jgi:hypothetical protein